MSDPSAVHLTRQPTATGYILGAASSLAFVARASAGTLIVPACAIPRDIDIPLDANDAVRTVAVSSPVRRATSSHIAGGMLSAPPAETMNARENAMVFQSGDTATSHTLSILAWKFFVSLP
jgi:hypothetical protein